MTLNKALTQDLISLATTQNRLYLAIGSRIITRGSKYPVSDLHTAISTYVTSISLKILVDLDQNFACEYDDEQGDLMGEFPVSTTKDNIIRFVDLIERSYLPCLQHLYLSIFEMIPPSKEVTYTSTVSKPQVLVKYRRLVGTIFGLIDRGKIAGIKIECVDVLYGDGFTWRGADPGMWWPAEPYFLVWQDLFKEYSSTYGDSVGWTTTFTAESRAPPNEREHSTREIFGRMRCTRPLEDPCFASYRSAETQRALPPSPRTPRTPQTPRGPTSPRSSLPPSPTTPTPQPPLRISSLTSPPRGSETLKKSRSLGGNALRSLMEGAAAITIRKRTEELRPLLKKEKTGESPPSSKQKDQALMSKRRTAESTPSPRQREKTPMLPREAGSLPRSESLGQYWKAGTEETLGSLSRVTSWTKKGPPSKHDRKASGEVGRGRTW